MKTRSDIVPNDKSLFSCVFCFPFSKLCSYNLSLPFPRTLGNWAWVMLLVQIRSDITRQLCKQLHILKVMSGAIILRICCHRWLLTDQLMKPGSATFPLLEYNITPRPTTLYRLYCSDQTFAPLFFKQHKCGCLQLASLILFNHPIIFFFFIHVSKAFLMWF